MEIVDAHTHIFPPEIIARRASIAAADEGFGKIYANPGAAMADHTSLLKYMEKEGVAVSVVCGFPFADKGLITLMNDYILDTARTYQNIIPLTAVNVRRKDGAAKEAERCLNLGAKGIGEVAVYEGGLGRDELKRLDEVARITEAKGGVLMLHINEQVGHHYDGKMPIDFVEVSKFIGNHRDLNIILAHMGGGLCFYEFMPEIRRAFSGVFYDMAAIPYIYSHEIYRFIDAFLPDKTLFGSDYPLLSLKRYEAGLDAMDREAKGSVLKRNAWRVFGHD
ncbi:MAG: amidohydrolase family protein [Syntrophobacterales bacterium]|jgi:predicted TIM-barrel fold metal-dependent hydrolase|nr:amidohydrolase family protein [Syntrophobacterales bacterium]